MAGLGCTGRASTAPQAKPVDYSEHADVRRVPIKSVQQQAVLSLHRLRSQWVKMRTAGVNALRGLLYEFGVVLPRGRSAGLRRLAERRADIDAVLPAIMTRLLDTQLQALRELDAHVHALEDELAAVQRSDAAAKRLRAAPGIGLLGATALAATLGDGSAWRNGREFACCLGLRQGAHGRYQQARRQPSANTAHPRRANADLAQQPAALGGADA